MNDFAYWLLREYGALGTIRHLNSTSLDLSSGSETVDETINETKMVLLPVSLITTYAQQMRSASEYGNLYAQGNSLIVLPVQSFTVAIDDIVTTVGFTFKVVDVKYLHHENVMELVVKA